MTPVIGFDKSNPYRSAPKVRYVQIQWTTDNGLLTIPKFVQKNKWLNFINNFVIENICIFHTKISLGRG